MTSKQFVALGKRLRPTLPGFTIWKSRLVMVPLGHTLRGIAFEPSGFSREEFYVNIFFMPLCVPTEQVHFTFGYRINRKQGWSVGEEDLEIHLRAALNKNVEFLTELQTVDDVARSLRPFTQPNERGTVNPHCSEALAYMLLRSGQEKKGRKVIKTALTRINSSVLWQRDIAERLQTILSLLSSGLNDAQSQLVAWEANNISTLGLGGLVHSEAPSA